MLENKKIAIIRLSAIGDVLNCTPVAAALRAAAPQCHLTWIVSRVAANVLRTNPDIDELIVWSREDWEDYLRHGQFRQAWQMYQQLKENLQQRHFDLALDVHGLFISGLVTRATGALRRIGLGGTKELNWAFMTEQAPACHPATHVIKRYLSILRPLGITTGNTKMTLRVDAEADKFAGNFLEQAGVKPGEPLLAISPSTTWPSKNWPPEYYAQVIAAVQPRLRVMLCGGPGDRELGQNIMRLAGVPVIDAIGATSLLELAGLLAHSSILLSGDTGPMHMAIALGTPTISLFGPTDPGKHGPLGAPHIVLRGNSGCGNCYKQVCRSRDLSCMRSITPDAVCAAIKTIIKQL